MREANRSHTHFQVMENDADSPGTCFIGEVVPKRRLCYRSFVELSVFEIVDDVTTQVEEDRSQSSTSIRRITASVD
ncbi:hypothetical protein TNCV_1981681 [Trichonephila clavipes]|nr:hypothetical protein TNCV_1981681 [Trichonephila clavipes]